MPGESAAKSSASRNSENELEPLRGAVRRRYGNSARVENVVVSTLGGINRTLIFDLVEGAARRRLVSRQESSGEADRPFLLSVVQFRVMRIAHAHGVPMPEPVFEYEAADAMGNGYVTAFVDGETIRRTARAHSRADRGQGAHRAPRPSRPGPLRGARQMTGGISDGR